MEQCDVCEAFIYSAYTKYQRNKNASFWLESIAKLLHQVKGIFHEFE